MEKDLTNAGLGTAGDDARAASEERVKVASADFGKGIPRTELIRGSGRERSWHEGGPSWFGDV